MVQQRRVWATRVTRIFPNAGTQPPLARCPTLAMRAGAHSLAQNRGRELSWINAFHSGIDFELPAGIGRTIDHVSQFSPVQGDIGQNVVEAAKRRGVRHFTNPAPPVVPEAETLDNARRQAVRR